ncbi:CAP domain-containing protein [Streptomyces poriticola]|uniref:CAP domain-containing protein n=1 Tax=Streptomyces poriticola TaxID=3120506 RepID=UPI002FCE171C
MGTRRADRPSRSHARPKGGRARNTAVVLGVVAVTAGAGFVVATSGGDGGDRSDQVAASGALETAGADETAAGGASPLASPAASPSTSSGSPSASTGPGASPEGTASPTRTAAPAPKPSVTEEARKTSERSGSGSGGGSAQAGSGTGAGADSGSSGSGSSGSGSSDGGSSDGGPEAQVLALVNEERAAAGCSPVTANDRLTRAADDYSDVMAASGVMSHTGPDGSTMTTRVEAAGYRWSTLGENIARGQADAASVMKAWMNSSGHRANILNCAFKELGVGVHFGDGGPWWTQNFGTSR